MDSEGLRANFSSLNGAAFVHDALLRMGGFSILSSTNYGSVWRNGVCMCDVSEGGRVKRSRVLYKEVKAVRVM